MANIDISEHEENPPAPKPALDLQRFKYTGSEARRSPRTSNAKPDGKTRSPSIKSSTDSITKPSSASPRSKPTSQSPSPSSSKAKRPPSRYAAPSRYAHLSPLVDILQPGLTLVFVGVNPGITTATSGHAYAHPSNRFWHLLHASGLTPERRLSPQQDRDLPALYNMGMTNIVARPSRDQGELSRAEMVEGAAVLDQKFAACRPEAVCLVGKGIWEAVWRHRHGRAMRKEEFRWGWQDEAENMGRVEGELDDGGGSAWDGARVFVATSTSGQAASMRPAEKEAVWRPLGEWMQKRRAGLPGSTAG